MSAVKIVQSSITTRLRGSAGTFAPRPGPIGLPVEIDPCGQAPTVSRLNSSIAARTVRNVSRSRASFCRLTAFSAIGTVAATKTNITASVTISSKSV
ncbi:MAG: hypothetical protein C4324_10045 [Blastocatellia bacterium]